MPILEAVAISTGIVVIGSYFLFRRVDDANRLDQDLQDVDAPLGMKLERVGDLTEAEALALKDAFVTSLEFQWMVEDTAKDAEAVTHNMIDYVIQFGTSYGHTIVCRDDNDEYLGSMVLIPPYRFQWLFDLHFLRCAIPLGQPKAYSIGSSMARERFDAFTNDTSAHHHKTLGSSPHWYVMNLGVAKTAQGKGVGRLLMTTAKKLSGGLPIYLECHNDNVAFYKKQGFEQSVFSLGKDKFPFNGMLHRHSNDIDNHV